MKAQISAERFLSDSVTGERVVFYECDHKRNKHCRKSACKPLGRGDDMTGCDATTDPKARAAAGKAFYIYCAPGERVEISRVYTRSGRRAIKTYTKAAKWLAIIAASLFLFTAAKGAALRARGYEAIGGEYALLLLPFIYYVAERTVKEWVDELHKLKGKGPQK